MRVIAFFTKDTGYEEEANIWKESFKSCDTKIYVVESRGSWEENCGIKPEILLTALQEFEEPILYVDIDARLKRPLECIEHPDLPGFCFLDKVKIAPYNRQLCSGTMYFPQTTSSFKIIIDWINLQKKNTKVWDQLVLQHIIESNKYKYQTLPTEWLGISRHNELENPIIYHTQASRRLKKEING